MKVKQGKAGDLVAMMQAEIVPRLEREEGFQDALILIAPDGREAIGLSLWSQRHDADRHERHGAGQMMKRLTEFLDAADTPRLFQVWSSTFHQIEPPAKIRD